MKILVPPRTGVLAAVASIAFALFVLLQFNHAWYYIPLSDDAWLATTAKNWAQGYGWATSYGERYLFDPAQTTGPGLLAFISLAIKIFGNKIWVPRVISLALNLALFSILLRRLYLRVPRATFFWVLLLLSFMYGGVNSYMWMTSLGDLTAFLYIALAAMAMHEALEDKRISMYMTCGIFSGLALLTKIVSAISLCGIMLLPIIHIISQPSRLHLGKAIFRALQPLAITVCAAALVVAPWFIYKQAILATLSHDELIRYNVHFQINFANSGSGLRALLTAYNNGNIINQLLQTVVANFSGYRQTLAVMFRPFTEFFWLFIVSLGGLTSIALCGRDKYINRLQLAFLLPAVSYLTWLIVFGQLNYGRFVLISIFVGFIGISIGISRAPLLAALLTMLMVFSVTFTPPTYFGIDTLYEWKADDSPMTRALQDVAAKIEKDYPDKPLVSCSSIYSREVEYALPGANRVIDCRYQLGAVLAFDEHAFFERYPDLLKEGSISGINIFLDNKITQPQSDMIAPVKWIGTTEFILVSNPMARAYNKFGMAAQYDAIVSHCDEQLYDNGYYALHLCRQQDLETAIANKGGMELVPLQWQWQSWIDEAKTGHR